MFSRRRTEASYDAACESRRPLRGLGDRRSVVIGVTEEGLRVLDAAPSLLQDRFRAELARLEEWERHGMLSALERIASMMDAEGIDAAAILEVGPVSQPADEAFLPEDVDPVLE